MAILDVVKFDGLAQGDWLVYKHYQDNLVLGTTLIVAEGQNALFVKGGQIADCFTSGTYKLATENLPILRKFASIPTGGQTPFSAEIFYINTTTKMNLPWGLSDPIQLVDPKYGVRLRVRSFGQCSLKVNDSVAFLKNLIGSMEATEMIKFNLVAEYFKGILITEVKTLIAQTIIDEKISALEISTKLKILSEKVTEALKPVFEQYGIALSMFNINSVSVPEEDLSKLTKILEEKANFDIIGDQHYAMKRSFDVYEGAANNANGAAGIMMGGGLGLGAGMQMMNGMQQMNQNTNLQQQKNCPSCGTEISINSKFCPNCGFSMMEKKCSCGAILKPGMKFCAECGAKNE